MEKGKELELFDVEGYGGSSSRSSDSSSNSSSSRTTRGSAITVKGAKDPLEVKNFKKSEEEYKSAGEIQLANDIDSAISAVQETQVSPSLQPAKTALDTGITVTNAVTSACGTSTGKIVAGGVYDAKEGAENIYKQGIGNKIERALYEASGR